MSWHWWFIPLGCAIGSIVTFIRAFGSMDWSGMEAMMFAYILAFAAIVSLITGLIK